MRAFLLIGVLFLGCSNAAVAGSASCTGVTTYSVGGTYNLSSECVVRSTASYSGTSANYVRWTLPSSPSDGDEFTGQDAGENHCEEFEGDTYCWTDGVDFYSSTSNIDDGLSGTDYARSWARHGWEVKLRYSSSQGKWVLVSEGCYLPGC